MKIDNTITIAKTKMFFVISFAIFISSLAYVLIAGFKYNYYFLGISVISLAVYIYYHLLNPYFFSYEKKGNKIIIRFYHAHPFIRKYKSYEIPIIAIVGYSIKTSFFGKRHEITLRIKTKKGTGNYPPLSISMLSFGERKSLRSALNSLPNVK